MAFQLRRNPNYAEGLTDDMQELFGLSGFVEDLRNYFLGVRAHQQVSLPFSSLSVWDRMRVQLKDPQDRELVLPALTVVACPHGEGSRSDSAGRYNFVLLHGKGGTEGLDDFGLRGEFHLQCLNSCVICC